MTKVISSTLVSTISQGQVTAQMIAMTEMDFSGGFRRYCTAMQPLFYDSNNDAIDEEFEGVGGNGQLGNVEEGAVLQAYNMTLTMTGIDSANLAAVLSDNYRNRAAKVWLGWVNPETAKLLTDPFLVFEGTMDTMDIELGKDAAITVTLESPLADWERPRIRRFTNEDQQKRDPTDQGLAFVHQMADRELRWGIA